MSSASVRAYHFETAGQWGQCLLDRFDVQPDGSLLPAPRLGSYAYRVAGTPPETLSHPIAIDPYGQPFLLADPSGPLAQSPRLVVDREWVWSFAAGGTTVQRSDRESLQLDLEVDLQQRVRDIASDSREGIWVLCGDEILYIVHFDCKGCPRERHRVPYEGERATEMGSVNRGRSLALLSKNRTRLAIVDGTSGGTLRTIDLSQLAPSWTVTQFTTDGWERIGLWGLQGNSDVKAGLLFVLDGNGDTVDGPFTGLFDHAEDDRRPRSLGSIRIAVFRQNVWLSTDTGLWRLDSSEAAGARESDSSLLTPVLYSPANATERGWLRAEVFADLPAGAALEVEIATTDSTDNAEKATAVMGDPSLTLTQKLERIRTLFSDSPQYSIPGPASVDAPISFPMLEATNQCAILRISVITPPGTAPSALRKLTVLYPNLSIADSLPAIFSGKTNDPAGTMRTLSGVLESTTQQFDERISDAASYLNALTTPEPWLDYLARWFDLPWDDALPPNAKRRILEQTGDLLGRRGTRDGLRALLECLLGTDAKVKITDLTAEYAPVRLGGCGQRDGTLPVLLAGVSLRTPTLGEKAVLGKARLCGESNALDAIVPTLRIQITAPQEAHRASEATLRRVLLRYVPAGMTISIRWIVAEMATPDVIGESGIVLDELHPGTLGKNSVIGHSQIGGRDRGRIGDAGFETVRLQ